MRRSEASVELLKPPVAGIISGSPVSSVVATAPDDGDTMISELSVQELLERVEAQMRADAAQEQTIRFIVCDLDQYLRWLACREKTVVEVDEQDLATYIQHLLSDVHELRPGCNGHYSESTTRRKISSVRKLYTMLQTWEWLARNPASHLRVPTNRSEAPRKVKFLPLDIIRKLLAAPDVCKPIGIRDRAILAFMALHGLRVSEVRQLNVADVNLEAGTVQALGRGGKPRVVFLTDPTRKVVGAWLATRRLMQVDDPALFITLHWTSGRAEPGQRISTRGLRQLVDAYMETIGVNWPGVSCQALRNTCAVLSLEAGDSLLAISEAIGNNLASTRALVRLAEMVLNA
jgi:integrase/recombinase XerD